MRGIDTPQKGTFLPAVPKIGIFQPSQFCTLLFQWPVFGVQSMCFLGTNSLVSLNMVPVRLGRGRGSALQATTRNFAFRVVSRHSGELYQI